MPFALTNQCVENLLANSDQAFPHADFAELVRRVVSDVAAVV